MSAVCVSMWPVNVFEFPFDDDDLAAELRAWVDVSIWLPVLWRPKELSVQQQPNISLV